MTLLRPGLHVVRRDDQHLQIGVDPPWRLIVPDVPEVQRLLADLTAGRTPTPDTAAAHRVLLGLARAGMLLDAPPTGPPGPPAAVALHGHGPLAAEATRLLRGARCGVTDSVTGSDAGRADLVLLLADGEPSRPEVDAQVRAGRPHLVVGATAYGYTVGPFVSPGATACLRCVDAHRGEHDPRRAVVVEQLDGRPGGPEDPVLCALAAAWAVRDVLTYLAGGRPATWSATVALGAELDPLRQPWSRHPHCGCSWAEGLVG